MESGHHSYVYGCDVFKRYQKGSTVSIQHLVNPTPVNWDCEQHATVITATYRSKLKAVENAKEQVMNMRYKMREWGVPISVPHKVLGGTGITVGYYESALRTFRRMAVRAAFAAH